MNIFDEDKIHNENYGFTLIEVLIYLGLFGLLFSGLFISALSIIENIGRNDTQIMVQEEGEFLLAKISYAVNGATSFDIPISSTLEIANSSAVIIKENGDYLEINGVALNNSATQIKNLIFTGDASKGFKVDFILQSKTLGGQIYSQNFQEDYFLRK